MDVKALDDALNPAPAAIERKMRRRSRCVTAAALALPALVACQMLAGLEDRRTGRGATAGQAGIAGGKGSDGGNGAAGEAMNTAERSGSGGEASGRRTTVTDGSRGGVAGEVNEAGATTTGGRAVGGTEAGGTAAAGAAGGGGETGGVGTGGSAGGGIETPGAGGANAGGVATGGATGSGGAETGGGRPTGAGAGGNTGVGGAAGTGAGTAASGGSETGGTMALGGGSSIGGGTGSGGASDGGGTGGAVPDGGTSAGGAVTTGGSTGRSEGCGAPTTAETGNGQLISVGGSSRTYNLRIPDDYDMNKPYRLMISYHWLNVTADSVSPDFYDLWDLSQDSTIFVAPQGNNKGWLNSGGTDVEFSRALIELLESQLCIDKSRIFCEGFSMGGSMAYAMASAAPELIRAVAVHSGGSMSGTTHGHTGPVAYFMTHGIKDSVCTYPGYGVPQLQDFAKVNGCTQPDPDLDATGFEEALPDPTSAAGACIDFQGCKEGYPVRACLFVGDHTASPAGGWVPMETWSFISQF
ncbi:MAG: hypothetical protein JW940_08755 [Polyangiaceae bacterium]|nr:hypothetical protein [Polyangiaceae bacterium]